MINLTPSQIGGLAILFVGFQISNQQETERVIKQLREIQKLSGVTVKINLKSTSKDGVANQSFIRPPEVLNSGISQALAIADASISPHYVAQPKTLPWKTRIDATKPKMRQIVQKAFKKKKGKTIITSRQDYMRTASKGLRGTLRGNDIYDAWVSLITARV